MIVLFKKDLFFRSVLRVSTGYFRGQKKVLDSLELDLQVVMNWEGAKNRIQVTTGEVHAPHYIAFSGAPHIISKLYFRL